MRGLYQHNNIMFICCGYIERQNQDNINKQAWRHARFSSRTESIHIGHNRQFLVAHGTTVVISGGSIALIDDAIELTCQVHYTSSGVCVSSPASLTANTEHIENSKKYF